MAGTAQKIIVVRKNVPQLEAMANLPADLRLRRELVALLVEGLGLNVRTARQGRRGPGVSRIERRER